MYGEEQSTVIRPASTYVVVIVSVKDDAVCDSLGSSSHLFSSPLLSSRTGREPLALDHLILLSFAPAVSPISLIRYTNTTFCTSTISLEWQAQIGERH